MPYEFDWTEFTEQDLKNCNNEIGELEDKIYRCIHVKYENKTFIVDVHYEYYDSRNHGFDLELYEENENGTHGTWVDFIKTIKSAKNYTRFCHRAEDAIIKTLNILI